MGPLVYNFILSFLHNDLMQVKDVVQPAPGNVTGIRSSTDIKGKYFNADTGEEIYQGTGAGSVLTTAGAEVELVCSIITNAMPDWVNACIERYYPKELKDLILTDTEGKMNPGDKALALRKKVEVISARQRWFTTSKRAAPPGSPGAWQMNDQTDP